MFGLFRKKRPDADQVVTHAIDVLGRMIPTAEVDRDELVLYVGYGRGFQLDLAPYVKMAAYDFPWEQALDLHAQAHIREADAPEEEAKPDHAAEEIQHAVRLVTFNTLPGELRGDDRWAVEPVAGQLWAMYGEDTEDGFAVMEWDALIPDDRHHLVRWLAAVRTLNRGFDGNFTRDHISVEMTPGLKLFTNDHHPQISAALLMPPAFWKGVMEAEGAEGIFVAVPAPSRLFWTPHLNLLEPMRALVANALALEDTTLSQEIYRFDGLEWHVVGSEPARA